MHGDNASGNSLNFVIITPEATVFKVPIYEFLCRLVSMERILCFFADFAERIFSRFCPSVCMFALFSH